MIGSPIRAYLAELGEILGAAAPGQRGRRSARP
jgi:hypothetical protein